MKGSKIAVYASALLAIATLLSTAGGWVQNKTWTHPVDLRYRYHESLCAHTGVNPFRVWNREVTTDEFQGIARPDMKYVNQGKKGVHAYPPWHVAYTWFFGITPYPFVIALAYFFYGIALSELLKAFKNEGLFSNCLSFAFGMFILFPPVIGCLLSGNYGTVCAGLLLCMMTALKRGEVLAGVCWGLMMIKPQMAMLLFFPLLFQKKFITIGVAVLMCIVGTLFMAHVYGESPLSLILQVPQIGAPYDTSVIFSRLMPRSLYPFAKYGWMLTCALLCAYYSWRWREAKNPVFRFAPAAFFFPLWTYSQGHDHIAMWPYVLLAVSVLPQMLASGKVRTLTLAYIVVVSMTACLAGVWEICVGFNIFSPAGIGWMYHAVMYPVAILHFIFGLYVLSFQNPSPKSKG